MIQQYSEDAWDKHSLQLENEFQPCSFKGVELISDCKASDPPPEELRWLRATLKSLPKVDTILDFGCGIGLFVGLFEGFNYTGADLTPLMLQKAEERNPDRKFVRSDGLSLEKTFSKGAFDLVFTRAVIQHNLEPVKSKIVQNIYNVLRPGGYYLFHEHQFILPGEARKETEEYMERFGFILVGYYPTSCYLFQK